MDMGLWEIREKNALSKLAISEALLELENLEPGNNDEWAEQTKTKNTVGRENCQSKGVYKDSDVGNVEDWG